MKKTFDNLKKGIVAPCYLLYGEEEYLINENLNDILDLLVPESDRDFNLFYLDGDNTDMDSLIGNLRTPSLLGDRKVIVVKNAAVFTSEDPAKLIQKIKDNMDENPVRAAKYFLAFLKVAGFSLEDLQNSGWQKITDEQWSSIVKGNAGEDREKWLPRILENYSGSALTGTSGADQTDRLEEILKAGLPAGNCLIFTAETVDKRKKIYKMIAELGVVLYFGTARGEAAQKESLKRESQKLLDGYGKKLSPTAWIALGKKTGFDLRRSLTELEKLVFFVGERETVEEQDVEEVVGKTREDSIFDLTTALSEKNQLAALAALRALLDQGTHHLMILTMIVREIRLLLQARILVDSAKLPKFNSGMEYGWFQKNIHPVLTEFSDTMPKDFLTRKHPFVVFNALRNCSRFTYPRLIHFLDELLELDRSFKSSAASPQLLLEMFLIRACEKN